MSAPFKSIFDSFIVYETHDTFQKHSVDVIEISDSACVRNKIMIVLNVVMHRKVS